MKFIASEIVAISHLDSLKYIECSLLALINMIGLFHKVELNVIIASILAFIVVAKCSHN